MYRLSNKYHKNYIVNLIVFVFSLFLWLACGQTKLVTKQEQEKDSIVDNPKVFVDPVPGKKIVAEKYTVDYIMGHFDPATHPDFTIVDIKYADRAGLYLRKDTYEAFIKMYNRALKDGLRLQIISATRNFEYQKGIWEAKWTGEKLIEGRENLAMTTPDPKARALKILRYSSMPGTSRHHWGTDMDLNSLENSWFDSGDGLTIYNWLKQHASEFGFCQPYTSGRSTGYQEEKWHWSYMPVSRELTNLAEKQLKNEMITGFKGSESAPMIDVVKNYVLGINQECVKM